VHKFSKNLGATSKGLAPEGWHQASTMLWTHNSGLTCKSATQYGLLGVKTAAIMLKIQGATLQK